jgi:hypothetical protein
MAVVTQQREASDSFSFDAAEQSDGVAPGAPARGVSLTGIPVGDGAGDDCFNLEKSRADQEARRAGSFAANGACLRRGFSVRREN